MEQLFFQGLILCFKDLLFSLIKKWKRRAILHSLLYTTSKTLFAWGRGNLVASQSVYKHQGSQKTQRSLSEAPWLGYLCRNVIHFLCLYCEHGLLRNSWYQWLSGAFDGSLTLPKNYPMWKWSHIFAVERCPLVGSETEISILWRALAMVLAVPGVRGGWSPSSALNLRWAQPCCSWQGCNTMGQGCSYQPDLPLLCLLGLEGRVLLSL